MKTILLPTDFSDNSWNAIEYALQLCEKWECTFYVLNVQKQSQFILDDLIAVPANTSIHDAIAKDNNRELDFFVTKLTKSNTNKNYTFKSLFDFDNLTEAINQAIISKNVDLIIMGTNGASGTKEVLFGSNTLNTIRSVNCPILTIPENYKFSKIDSILFTTENCKGFNENGIKPLKNIISTYNSRLRVININISNDLYNTEGHINTIKALFTEQPFTYKNIKNVPTPMVISTITQLYNYNMHSLFIESETFLERFLYGSTTSKISYNSTVPLLILRK